MTRWIRPPIAIVVIALAIWQVRLLLAALGGHQENVGLETAVVKEGPFTVGIAREGTLESASVATVRAPESGSTIAWLIEDGAEVKPGDLIARVDVSQYKFEVDQQRLRYQDAAARVEREQRNRSREAENAELSVDRVLRALDMLGRSQLVEKDQAQAQVGYDQWNLAWAERDYQKQARLLDMGIVPQTTVEQSERRVRSREFALDRSGKSVVYLDAEHAAKQAQQAADVDSARYEVEVAKRRIREAVENARRRTRWAEERLRRMEQQLAQGEARAPAAGVVVLGQTWDQSGQRTLRQGDRVSSGMELATIADLSQLEVALRVEDSAAARVKPGQEAVVTAIGVPGREFRAKVLSVGAVARLVPPWEDPSAQADQRVFDVRVRIEKPDLKVLRPGMKAKVQFVFERLPKAIYVPKQAVFGREGSQVVYLLSGDRFVPRKVKVGKRSEETVQIVRGLKPGDRVALADPTRREGE